MKMCSNGVWPEELDEDFTEMEKKKTKTKNPWEMNGWWRQKAGTLVGYIKFEVPKR